MKKIRIILLIFVLSISISYAFADDNLICHDCNVVMIHITNVRVDHLSSYGYSRATTPNIDALADQSIVFENAFSVASWTLPAGMSIFTSKYPFTHKVMSRYQKKGSYSRNVLSEDIETFVERLKLKGYKTASINADRDYDTKYGLTNRFHENYSFSVDEDDLWGRYGSIYDVVPKALEWLEENKKEKFLLHLQAYDAHCPFAYPRENKKFDPKYTGDINFKKCYWTFEKVRPIKVSSEGQEKTYYLLKSRRDKTWDTQPHKLGVRDIEHMISLYDGEIYNIDEQLGRVFKYLKDNKLMKNTIIIVLSEHGDLFGEHGRFMRGGPIRGTFYDEVLHVPLIIYHPKIAAKRIASLVSLVDIAPTVLDYLGMDIPQDYEGMSLKNVVQEDNLDRIIYAGSLYTPPRQSSLYRYSTIITSVRDAKRKLIREMIFDRRLFHVSYEFFDIEHDPKELMDRSLKDFEEMEKYNNLINQWISDVFGQVSLQDTEQRR